jgi:transposase-like protein
LGLLRGFDGSSWAIRFNSSTTFLGNTLRANSSVVISLAFFFGFGIRESPMKPVSLFDLMDDYDTEKECRAALAEIRWPDGVKCPRCNGERHAYDSERYVWDCYSCGYQFSVMSGTIFHDTKLPLRKWFMAVLLMVEARKGISANQMKRTLGVSYKTAWYLCHRIRAAMKDLNPIPLTGLIEADETWIGGRQKGVGRGNWRVGKKMVLGAIERGGHVRLKVDERPSKRAVHSFLHSVVDREATDTLYTDEHSAYIGFAEDHEHVVHRDEEWVRGEVHVNTVESVWSHLKRSVVGSYHQLSEKHLQAYVDEFSFRFNNRHNPYLFRDTLMKLVNAESLPYGTLIST